MASKPDQRVIDSDSDTDNGPGSAQAGMTGDLCRRQPAALGLELKRVERAAIDNQDIGTRL